jgi:tetratricopeptide (TPR) repeat protein
MLAQDDPLIAEAKNQYELANYESSLALVETALASNQNDFEAWMIKADSYHKQHDFDEAIENYKRAYDLNKSSALLMTNWGAALLNLKNYEAAEKKLKDAFKLDKNLAQTHYFMGNLQYANFNSDLAIKCYNRAIELDPDYMEAYYMRAASNAEKGDLLKAKKDYEKVHELDPDLVQATYNMAVLYIEAEEYDEALKLLDEIDPSSLPSSVDYYFYQAEALYFSGDETKSCEVYKQAADLGDTESAEIYKKYCQTKEQRNEKRKKTVIRMSF